MSFPVCETKYAFVYEPKRLSSYSFETETYSGTSKIGDAQFVKKTNINTKKNLAQTRRALVWGCLINSTSLCLLLDSPR